MRHDLFHVDNKICPACNAMRLHTEAELHAHHPSFTRDIVEGSAPPGDATPPTTQRDPE